MRLTWRDATVMLVVGAITGIYLAYLRDAGGWPFNSVRGMVGAMFVLGTAGGCALGDAGRACQTTRTPGARELTVVRTLLGGVALTTAIIGLTTGEAAAIPLLYATIVALWILSTARHAFSTDDAGTRPHASR